MFIDGLSEVSVLKRIWISMQKMANHYYVLWAKTIFV